VPSPSATASRPSRMPTFRILDPEEVEARARDRQAWADLWQAIACETDAADETPPDDGIPVEQAS
jgi:hypothetical protein